MVKLLFLLCSSLLWLKPAAAIEITLAKSLGRPDLPAGKAEWQLGFAQIAWIGHDKLIYNRTPHYWELDINTGEFTRLWEIEQQVGEDSSMAIAMARADSAVLDYGRLFSKKYAIFDVKHGWRDIDEVSYEELAVYPITDNSHINAELMNDWEYRLLGDYRLVPRPIVHGDNCGLSLREPQGGKLRRLPTEFYEFRNICSYAELALSFDRFRVAVVGEIVKQKPDSPYELGWRVYLLRVTYNGAVENPVIVRTSPNASSEEAGHLEANIHVRVTEAMNYEKDQSGRQDFWYRVEDGQFSGWVFGGDLLIEGQTWTERLKLRGEPVDLDALLKDK
jgi:hypothetical protein